MNEALQLKRRLDAASAVVAAARKTLGDGSVVDLSGLEQEVATICKGLNALPIDEASAFKSPLIALADDLDMLTKDLTETHQKLSKEIGGVSMRHKVTKAYVKPLKKTS
jgi:hypothetical protein